MDRINTQKINHYHKYPLNGGNFEEICDKKTIKIEFKMCDTQRILKFCIGH